MTKTKQELLDMVNGWIKNKELHKMRNKPCIKNNVFMVDTNHWDQPNQASVSEDLASEKIGYRYINKFTGNINSSDLAKYDKEADKLSTKYYFEMDKCLGSGKIIDYLIKKKLGKNLDELIEDRYLRLDPDDVVWDLQNQKTMQIELKKDDGVEYLGFTSSTGYVYGSKKKK